LVRVPRGTNPDTPGSGHATSARDVKEGGSDGQPQPQEQPRRRIHDSELGDRPGARRSGARATSPSVVRGVPAAGALLARVISTRSTSSWLKTIPTAGRYSPPRFGSPAPGSPRNLPRHDARRLCQGARLAHRIGDRCSARFTRRGKSEGLRRGKARLASSKQPHRAAFEFAPSGKMSHVRSNAFREHLGA